MSKKIKVTYVVSRIDKALSFEWIAIHMNKSLYDLEFILLNENKSDFAQFCKQNNIACKEWYLQGKCSYPRIILKLIFHFVVHRPKYVHAHLFDAALTAMIAAKIAFIPNRIYTRHHSTYHFDYHPNSVKWDLKCNQLSTKIIAISENVKNVLIERENVNPQKIVLIHHGIDIHSFINPDKQELHHIKQVYNPTGKAPVIGVIARLTELKGTQYIIAAFERLLLKQPNALLLLFNAKGELKNTIEEMLNRLPASSWKMTEFENNITSLYHIFDYYIHVPINKEIEAFGQTYIEALAAGTPSIFTLSGVAPEFIIDHHNAIVVPFCDSEAIYMASNELTASDVLRENIIRNGQQDIQQFSLSKMMTKLEQLYV